MKYGLWLPASIMLIAIMSLSLVFSSTNFVTIGNLGQISINEITAASGSAADIQAAVNQVAARTGRGKVHIPPGNFNWVNVGESWRTVSVPAGIDVIGGVVSGTDSYGLGVPTTWSTVIQVPQSFNTGWNKLNFFDIGDGSQDPTKPVRIANLKFVGYRTFNPSSKDMYIAIMVYGVINYRVDHCCFENLAGGVLGIFPYYNQNMYCCGVFDHNWAYNTHGWADLGSYVAGNIDNAIELHRSYYALDGTTTSPFPFDPTMNVLGQYTKYTCFIENNIFSRWYHSVSSGHGAHYVFRYNVDDQSDGTMQIDLHGVRDDRPSGAGGRCMEVYENRFIDRRYTNDAGNPTDGFLMQSGGGCGAWFNNYIDNTYQWISLYAEDYIGSETWHIRDMYLWSALGPGGSNVQVTYPTGTIDPSRNVAVNWARQAGNATDLNYPNTNPSWSIAGYKPYTYPHPLAME